MDDTTLRHDPHKPPTRYQLEYQDSIDLDALIVKRGGVPGTVEGGDLVDPDECCKEVDSDDLGGLRATARRLRARGQCSWMVVWERRNVSVECHDGLPLWEWEEEMIDDEPDRST